MKKKKRSRTSVVKRKKKVASSRVQKKSRSRIVWRTLFFLSVFALLAFFYPGDGIYQHVFAYSHNGFNREVTLEIPKVNAFPVVSNSLHQPVVTSNALYVADLTTFTPVLQRNPHRELAPASTTKVIAALVAFETFDLHDQITVERSFQEGRVMGLVQGETLTFESLLYGLLVHSANDAAYAIADNYPGGFDEFVQAMNEKAKDLHMNDSKFVDPAGLDRQGQHTSAFDLALAGRELLANETLSSIVSTRSISVSDVNFTYFHDLTNVNKLLGQIAGVGGLKTGQTPEAGENLITFYKQNGHNFLIVILRSEDRFMDTENVVRWLDTNVEYVQM